jgi:hypothetical protein
MDDVCLAAIPCVLEHLSEIISENRTERPRHRSGERTPGGEKGPLPLLRVQLFGETLRRLPDEDAYAPQKFRRC